MDCPVCKYPNPTGATHCGMCHEVFNRSAAQAYLHEIKRQKEEKERIEVPANDLAGKANELFGQARGLLQKVDWDRIRSEARSLLKRSRNGLLIAGGILMLWIVASFLLDPNLWFHIFGKRISYAFDEHVPVQYLVGLTQQVKTWTERGGRLDTPLEEYKLENIGNVLLEREPDPSGPVKVRKVLLHAKEWIELLNGNHGSASRAIPLDHPSLAPVMLDFNKRGTLVARQHRVSQRAGKAAFFVAPQFPSGLLHRDRMWDEPVEWLDIYEGWKIDWKGTFHWTLDDLQPCSEGTCAHLLYQANLEPTLWAAPAWAGGARRVQQPHVSSEGSALFDVKHKRLVSNTFSYEGLIHIPLRNLGEIPRNLRIGRRVKGPGEFLLRFENKIDVHKN